MMVMGHIKKLHQLLGLLSISMGAIAQPTVTPEAVPQNLHVYNSAGNAYVDMPASGCSGVRYLLSPGHLKYDSIFSLLLSAQATGKRVQLRFDGCNTLAQGLIVGVYLKE